MYRKDTWGQQRPKEGGDRRVCVRFELVGGAQHQSRKGAYLSREDAVREVELQYEREATCVQSRSNAVGGYCLESMECMTGH